jgi:4-hydroxy-tetrahydrodipicolinate synthase
MRRIVDRGVEVPGLAELVTLALQYPIVPAVKALAARRWRDDSLLATAPPLVAVDPDARRVLGAALDRMLVGE